MNLLALRRGLVALLGVSLMLVAVYNLPIAVVDGAWARGLGLLGVGIFGLWLLQFSRPKKASDDMQANANPALPDEEL